MSGGINTPAQAVAAANSWLTYTHRFCLQAVSRMYQKGSPTQVSAVDPPIDDILTAAQEWARCPAQYRHEGRAAALAAPVGALIVCGNGDGHIFIVVAPGMGRSTDYPTAGKMGTDTIANILAHFSGNPVLGWISWINGNTIDGLGVAPTGPMQRVARSDVGIIRRRAAASTTSALLDPALQPGETGNFVGYVHGERVNQNGVDSDVWLVGISKNYFWLGGFVDRDLHDLPDLTPPPVVTAPPAAPYSVAAAGIDVSGYQDGVDWQKAKSDGVQFAIVKLGGHNVDPLYTSSDYASLVDGAMAADLPVGHYFVSGKGDPKTAAAYFVQQLHAFDVNADVLMLDNETLDANGATWSPTDAAAFIAAVVALTGIDPKRIWHYASASTYKSGVDWAPTVATGARFVYAAYGSQPYATDLVPTASSNPEPNGAIPDWDVHQFTDAAAVGGVKADGLASRLPVAVLFAKGTVLPPVTDGDTPDPGSGTTDPGDGTSDGGSTPTNPQPTKGQTAGIWAGICLLLAGIIAGIVSAISHLF